MDKCNYWDKNRRIIIVRQKISKPPNTTGRTLSLFPEDEIHRNYRYSSGQIVAIRSKILKLWGYLENKKP